MSNLSKTLSQLESDDWGEPNEMAPPSIKRCYELRNIPLDKLTVEDLRLLIGQDIGLQYLMPLAVDALIKNPLIKGQHYYGDLLVNVLSADAQYYKFNKRVKEEVKGIIKSLPDSMALLDSIDCECTSEAISEALEEFGKTER